MELQELTPYQKELVGCLTISSRALRKVYYISNGRNAWHGTWVRQYRVGCLHTTLQSAKRAAEKWRVNGSVFYIEQLPALVLSTAGKLSVIVTQLNNEVPLEEYKPNGGQHRAIAELDFRISRLTARIQRIKKGSHFKGAIDSFENLSGYWDCPVLDPHKPHLLWYNGEPDSLEKYVDSKSNRLKSLAIGADYLLAWESHPNNRSSKAIRRILVTRPSKQATY